MNTVTTQTVLVTGAGGLLGFHVSSLLLAKNGERAFHGQLPAFNIRKASTFDFDSESRLQALVEGCDLVMHLAGVNRAAPEIVEQANADIASRLVRALNAVGARPHVVYANSTHESTDTPYGRGKHRASVLLSEWAEASTSRYSNIVLPHLFGEGGLPNYNTVTATLCEHLKNGTSPTIHDGATVELLHAGKAADIMLKAALGDSSCNVRAEGTPLTVRDLYHQLRQLHEAKGHDVFPDLAQEITVQLYNTLRYPSKNGEEPRVLQIKNDARGELFEVARGGGGGQTFLSWTKPGVERGNHFHRRKVERFVVLQGEADIHLRKVFDNKIHTHSVTGEHPVAVDIPTLHTHSIVNTGDSPLLTLFWVHEIFDPTDTDTFMHQVRVTEAEL